MKSIKSNDIAMLLLRVVVGLIMVYAGSQKVFGILGGPGFKQTIEFFGKDGIPMPFAVLAMAGELLGGLGLIFGVLPRIAAFGVACTMAVATFKTATMDGVWHKLATGENGGMNMVGFPLVLFAGAVTILLLGGGRFCLDRLVFGRKKASK